MLVMLFCHWYKPANVNEKQRQTKLMNINKNNIWEGIRSSEDNAFLPYLPCLSSENAKYIKLKGKRSNQFTRLKPSQHRGRSCITIRLLWGTYLFPNSKSKFWSTFLFKCICHTSYQVHVQPHNDSPSPSLVSLVFHRSIHWSCLLILKR